MDYSYESLLQELKKRKIRLSHQRLKVLEYLCNTLNHPTADQIYNDLQRDIPTLSKTTVYNSLYTLISAGLVRVINIEDHETRYDIITENHGHFKCTSCGSIFNFAIDFECFSTDDLEGYQIDDRNVYFKGICPKCLYNISKLK